MQLGFVSAILPDLPLQEVFKIGSEAGYDCVELMCWPEGPATRRYAGVSHVNVRDISAESARSITRLASQYHLTISALGYYPNPLSADREESDAAVVHIKEMIRAAASMRLGTVNSFVGRDHFKTVEENWPRFVEVWKPLVRFAEQHGIRIGIENCPMFFTRDEWPSGKNLAMSPTVWRRMFEEIPSPSFGLNFDPSHMVWQQMDYLRPLREFSDRLVHIHAKDARLDRDRLNEVGVLATPNEYHTPKLPGLGDVDWGRFFSALTDAGYDGPVCVEVEDRAYEGSLKSRIAALRQSARYLRQFIPAD